MWKIELLEKHIRDNTTNQYSSMVVAAALFKKIYGRLPKIGMSGQQAVFADILLKDIEGIPEAAHAK